MAWGETRKASVGIKCMTQKVLQAALHESSLLLPALSVAERAAEEENLPGVSVHTANSTLKVPQGDCSNTFCPVRSTSLCSWEYAAHLE